MHRFFLSVQSIHNDSVVIDGETAHRMREVLRLKVRDRVMILDNTGMEYHVELKTIQRHEITGKVVDKGICENESMLGITLYQSLLKSDKFELVLQKCTEMGVTEFIPIICERCVADRPSESRFHRWQKIVVEAAEQSKRGKIPELGSVLDFKQACENTSGFSLIPWELEKTKGIKTALTGMGSAEHINIFIGPEGGFTPTEIEIALSKGITPVTLGKRILRAETAGLVVVTAVFYEYGEMN